MINSNIYSSNTTTTSSSSSQPDNQFRFELNVANVGHCEAVLCRSSLIHPLTRRFTIPHDESECKRVRKASNIIITEDNALNAITSQTRMLGCSFLYPAILPTPHISSFILSKNDEFLIIANNLLWQVIEEEKLFINRLLIFMYLLFHSMFHMKKLYVLYVQYIIQYLLQKNLLI